MVVLFIPVTCKIHCYNRLLESAYKRDHLYLSYRVMFFHK